MKKFILALLLVMITGPAFAQETVLMEAPHAPGDETSGPPVYPIGQALEDQMVFIRLGQTVGQMANTTQRITMNSLGYLRYSEDFIYGVEFSSFLAPDINVRTTTMQAVGGYRHTWSKRFIPYIMVEYGPTQYSGISTSTGIATSFDLGMDVIKTHGFKGSVGFRRTTVNSADTVLSDVTYTDLYILVGFVF